MSFRIAVLPCFFYLGIIRVGLLPLISFDGRFVDGDLLCDCSTYHSRTLLCGAHAECGRCGNFRDGSVSGAIELGIWRRLSARVDNFEMTQGIIDSPRYQSGGDDMINCLVSL